LDKAGFSLARFGISSSVIEVWLAQSRDCQCRGIRGIERVRQKQAIESFTTRVSRAKLDGLVATTTHRMFIRSTQLSCAPPALELRGCAFGPPLKCVASLPVSVL
jgi:hypothetical protein